MKQIAYIDWNLLIKCPHCGTTNDLSKQVHDAEQTIAKAIFANLWHELDNLNVKCESCKNDFMIDKVEY